MNGMRKLVFYGVLLVLGLGSPVAAQRASTDSTVVADSSRRETDTLETDELDEYFVDGVPENPSDTVAVNAPNDRSTPAVRYPTAEQLNEYRQDRAYQYGDDVPPPESFIGKLLNWFFRNLREFFASPSYQNFWRYVILLAVAALVVYLGVKAEFLGFLSTGRGGRATLDYETLTEDIHRIDFAKELEAATETGNFRLAVRLLYLQALKQLADRRLIDWKPDKTNQQYAYELAGQPFGPMFNTLTRDFEYVWYGNFPVGKEQFAQIQEQFGLFGRQLPTLNPARS